MNARKWSCVTADPVRDDRQAECRKTGKVTIGIEDEIGNLGSQAIHDMRKQGRTGERQKAFIAAPHAARFAACKKNADDRFRQVHYSNVGL